MKTSYYAKFSRLPKEEQDKYIPIRISNTKPKWFPYDCLDYSILSPDTVYVNDIKNNNITEEDFEKAYISYLELLNILEDALESLKEMEDNVDLGEPILLCYETSSNFCHRHILRKYLKEYKNIDIEEL